MESPTNRLSALETALNLHRQSLRLVPLHGKTAFLSNWYNLRLDESDIRYWSRHGVNWGIITGDPLIVLDTDTLEAEHWVKAQQIESPVMVHSGGGGLHRYFRCLSGETVQGRSAVHRIPGLDVKGWHGYIVAAGSIHPETGIAYQYLPRKELKSIAELPLFCSDWVREIRIQPNMKPKMTSDFASLHRRIADIRAYIRAIPSIQGQCGDKACFRVACLLVREGMDFDEAIGEMIEWNRHSAIPPWSEKELVHKLRCAFNRVTKC